MKNCLTACPKIETPITNPMQILDLVFINQYDHNLKN